MKSFFKSVSFKIILAIALTVVGIGIYAVTTGGYSSLPSRMLEIAVAPIRDAAASLSHRLSSFTDRLMRAEEIEQENEVLREENRILKNFLIDYEELRRENEQYKAFLDIKEQNPDFTFQPAFVVGRDPADPFQSFTIDRGEQDGVTPGCPVITADGVVGKVIEVGARSAKVMTVLDVSFEMGVLVVSTRDTGIVQGDVAMAQGGHMKLRYLSPNSLAKEGDLLMTTGVGGVFPKGLVVGTILSVESEGHGISLYAEVVPVCSIADIKDVVVITDFDGKSLFGTGAGE